MFYAYFFLVKNAQSKINKKMNIFSILKIDDEYSVMHYPLDRLKLDPLTDSPDQSGLTTTPLDGVSVLLIQSVIF
jgi:hypothetical protein